MPAGLQTDMRPDIEAPADAYNHNLQSLDITRHCTVNTRRHHHPTTGSQAAFLSADKLSMYLTKILAQQTVNIFGWNAECASSLAGRARKEGMDVVRLDDR